MKNPSNSKIIYNVSNVIFIALLACYGLLGEITSTKLFIVGCALVVAGGIYLNRRIRYDTGLFFLMQALILVVYSNFFMRGLANTDAVAIISPVLAYIVGLSMVNVHLERNNTVWLYFAISIGMTVYGILSLFAIRKHQIIGTYFGIKQENPELLNMQLVEFLFLGLSASLIWAVVTLKKHKLVSLLLILAIIVVQPILIKYHGRYNAYIFVAQIVVLLIMLIYNIAKQKVEKKNKVAIITTFIMMVLLMIALLIYQADLFGCKSIYYTSFWGQDGGLLKSVKFLNMKEMIKLLFINWQNPSFITSNGINTSFNMWLDYGRDYGIVCFAVLYGFKVVTVINAVRLIISKQVSTEIKSLLLPIYVIVNIFYSYEFIAKTNAYLWHVGLCIAAMISANLLTNNQMTKCKNK